MERVINKQKGEMSVMNYKQDFLEYAINLEVLKFGEFTLKSGRTSPYFFNSGLFNSGEKLAKLSKYYAQALKDSGLKYDVLYGPAYKGIPLVSGLSIALSNEYGEDIPYSFNRKEEKTHGDGGKIVGAKLRGNVLIVEDVITAGTSVRESIEIIKNQGATPSGVLISLDRQEKGKDSKSAIMELKEKFGLKVFSIAKMQDIIEYLKNKEDMQEHLKKMKDYRKQYGT